MTWHSNSGIHSLSSWGNGSWNPSHDLPRISTKNIQNGGLGKLGFRPKKTEISSQKTVWQRRLHLLEDLDRSAVRRDLRGWPWCGSFAGKLLDPQKRVRGWWKVQKSNQKITCYEWNPMKTWRYSQYQLVKRISAPSTVCLFLWVHLVYLSDGIPAISCRDFVIWRNNYRTGHCCRWIWTNQRIQESDGMWRFPGFFHIFPGPFWCLYTAPKGAYEMMVISNIFYWCLPD